MEDKDIIKALGYCVSHDECGADCPCFSGKLEMCGDREGLLKQCLDLINRQKAEIINRTEEYNDMLEQRNKVEEAYELCKQEYDSMLTANRNLMAEVERLNKQNDELTYKLWGVMHSVDKWLDGEELEQDEVNRACTMREKTLQITEQQQAEVEQWKEEANRYQNLWCEAMKDIQTAKSGAIKEYKEKVKSILISKGLYLVVVKNAMNEVEKEMVGEN